MQSLDDLIYAAMGRQRWLIENTLDRLDHTHDFAGLVKMVINGEAQFWPMPHAFLITELVQYPRRKICRIGIAGGRMQDLLALHDKVVAFARHEGCDEIEIIGRRGWLRVFGHPWRFKQIVMVRPVARSLAPAVEGHRRWAA
jgi:hypothetical protein